jgi:hypothetical protein
LNSFPMDNPFALTPRNCDFLTQPLVIARGIAAS